jgi:hypothetical protein
MNACRKPCVLLVGIPALTIASAQVPSTLAYQGRVFLAGAPFQGTGQFKCALVNREATRTFWSNDGTGVGGSEPQGGLALPVIGGSYTATLGDTNLPSMQLLPPTVFTNTDIHIRVWFNDGGLYSPDSKTWSPLPGSPLEGVAGAAAFRTGGRYRPALDVVDLDAAARGVGNAAVSCRGLDWPGPAGRRRRWTNIEAG